MKKYLRFANLLALGAGAVGMLLQLWLFSAGTDERGLYPASHPAWVLLGILTAAVVAAVWLLTRQAGNDRNFRRNFPASPLAAMGCVAGVAGLLFGGLSALDGSNILGLLAGGLGIASAISLAWGAACRSLGKRSRFPVHCLPCLFFALTLFVLGQEFGSEPEMCRYLYRFWGIASAVPACYWLWSFDVNLGRRRVCLFWCLVAGYCNLAAAIGSDQTLLHLGVAIWMLTALPRLSYLPKPPKPAPEEVPEAPAPEPAEDPTAVVLPDADAIIGELLQDLQQQEP